MAATQLAAGLVDKPWGRRDLPASFGRVAEEQEPVGEAWFSHPRFEDAELLVKYLFTSEKLSIQVHPDERAARSCGHARGKDEAWFILKADEGASIALGTKHAISGEQLRAAALDGSIEQLLEWQPVAAGDILYSPAGTIHAIGAGLMLIEIQQNVDVTYRLYDYGRPRELHLDQAIEVARPIPYVAPFQQFELEPGRFILSDGSTFVLERWTAAKTGTLRTDPGRALWVVPIESGGSLDGAPLEAGSAWIVEGSAELSTPPEADLLIAYPGHGVIGDLLHHAG